MANNPVARNKALLEGQRYVPGQWIKIRYINFLHNNLKPSTCAIKWGFSENLDENFKNKWTSGGLYSSVYIPNIVLFNLHTTFQKICEFVVHSVCTSIEVRWFVKRVLYL